MIYVASSWRNEYQPTVVLALQAVGVGVYDFRNPEEGDNGFHWSEIDPAWQRWTWREYVEGLGHSLAIDGFGKDFEALDTCDGLILVLPCGRSAHLEAGYVIGQGKPSLIYKPEPVDVEPELMNKLADAMTDSMQQVLSWAQTVEREAGP